MAQAISMPMPMPVPFPSTEAESDDAIMCRVRSGAVRELAELFERHQTALLNFFLRLGAKRAGAEDLVQDVFVRILKYRATYRPGSKFTTWMYSIARNARLNYLHQRRGETEWDDAYAPVALPGDAAQADQEQQILQRALARLPEEKREILVLARYQEMNYSDIGALLRCETGTVKVRVHRALRELREHYLLLANRGGQ
ncbi:MAG: RNA polymerase sigma factor [Terriglobales bacterium]